MQKIAIQVFVFNFLFVQFGWADSSIPGTTMSQVSKEICYNESMPGVNSLMVFLGKAYEDIYMNSLLTIFNREGVTLNRDQIPQGRIVRNESLHQLEWKDVTPVSFHAGNRDWNLQILFESNEGYDFYKPILLIHFYERFNALGEHIGYQCIYRVPITYRLISQVRFQITNLATHRVILEGTAPVPNSIKSHPGLDVNLDLNGNVIGPTVGN